MANQNSEPVYSSAQPTGCSNTSLKRRTASRRTILVNGSKPNKTSTQGKSPLPT